MELQFNRQVTMKLDENDFIALKAFFTGWTDRKIINELYRKVSDHPDLFNDLDIAKGAEFLKELERTYRLEFNEKQQNFHLDNFTHQENTHGWFTIFEHCTDLEFRVYEAFVNRIPQKKLTKDYLLKCAHEVKGFMKNLTEYGLDIQSTKHKNL